MAKKRKPSVRLLRDCIFGFKGDTIRWDDIHYEDARLLVDIGSAELVEQNRGKAEA